jgi:hypothetical protein
MVRAVILSCEMGTGLCVVGGSLSIAELIEPPKGVAPAMTFTWSREVSEGLLAASR